MYTYLHSPVAIIAVIISFNTFMRIDHFAVFKPRSHTIFFHNVQLTLLYFQNAIYVFSAVPILPIQKSNSAITSYYRYYNIYLREIQKYSLFRTIFLLFVITRNVVYKSSMIIFFPDLKRLVTAISSSRLQYLKVEEKVTIAIEEPSNSARGRLSRITIIVIYYTHPVVAVGLKSIGSLYILQVHNIIII